MKKLFLFSALLVAVLGLCSAARADLGITYSDKVVWRGFELFGETDGLSPQLNFKAGPLDVAVRGLLAGESGYSNLERWDGQISYAQRAGPLVLTTGYGYYYYPDSDLDFQEMWGTVGVPIGPLTPRYTLVRADGDGAVESAWLHVAGADLKLTEQARVFAEAVYNEGFNPFGGTVESGWSHAMAGGSLDVQIAERLVVTPAVYYQYTIEEAVNPEEHQVWFAVSLNYKF